MSKSTLGLILYLSGMLLLRVTRRDPGAHWEDIAICALIFFGGYLRGRADAQQV